MAEKVYLIKESTLKDIGDAIRGMGVESGVQITDPIPPLEMPGAISSTHSSEVTFVGNLKYNEGYDSAREEFYQPRYDEGYDAGRKEINDLANGTSVTAGTVLNGQTFYKNGQILNGTMPNNSIQTIYLDATTKKYTIPTGYHSSGGSVQIRTTTGSATPTTSNKTHTPTNGYLYSNFTVQGDNYLRSENIKSGVSIFGVNGTFMSRVPVLFETTDNSDMWVEYVHPDEVGYLDSAADIVYEKISSGTVLELIPGTFVIVSPDSDLLSKALKINEHLNRYFSFNDNEFAMCYIKK